MGGPGPRLDGAGMAKMAVLEEALATMALVHSQVEKMGVAIKNKQPTTVFVQAIKRQITPLTTKLKMQFGMIADQLMAMLLASTRGASEQVRLRTMREHVAQVKVALEIAVAQTIVKHQVKEGTPPRGVETTKPATPRASQAVPRPSQVTSRPSEAIPRPTQPVVRAVGEGDAPVRPSVAASGPVAAPRASVPAAAPRASVPAPAPAPAPTAAVPPASPPPAESAPKRATAAGRALSELPEEGPRRTTSAELLDENGQPIARRSTRSVTSEPDTGSA